MTAKPEINPELFEPDTPPMRDLRRVVDTIGSRNLLHMPAAVCGAKAQEVGICEPLLGLEWLQLATDIEALQGRAATSDKQVRLYQSRRRAASRPCSLFGTRYSMMARAMAVRSSGESSMNPTSFAGVLLVWYTALL